MQAAYAMSAVGPMPPSDQWETRSAMSGPAGPPPVMMGYGIYAPHQQQMGHRQMPSYGSGYLHPGMMAPWSSSASAMGMPAHRPGSSVNLARLPHSPLTGPSQQNNTRLRFETR